MNRKKKLIHLILWKYKQNEALTEKEEKALYAWVSASELRQQVFDELSNNDYWDNEVAAFSSKEGDPAWNVIAQRLDDVEYFENRQQPVFRRYGVAAAVLGLIAVGIFVYNSQRQSKIKHENYASKINQHDDVLPASDHAILQIGDGSFINLSKIDKKMPAMEKFGMFISAEDGFLVYRTDVSTKVEQHLLKTPRATQYKLSLPDGTRVWLNAGSSIRFPTAFKGPTREVELTGEGYFEVAKMPTRRFIVKAGNSFINVLGTHFNINAYKDERAVVTTLLEGSVLVKTETDSIKLVPNEKVTVTADNKMKVAQVDVERVVAWKQQMFWFQDQPIPEIMREIARWYDVNVIFKGEVKDKFTAVLPRDLTLGQLLAVIDSTGKFSFEVKNKTITVVP